MTLTKLSIDAISLAYLPYISQSKIKAELWADGPVRSLADVRRHKLKCELEKIR